MSSAEGAGAGVGAANTTGAGTRETVASPHSHGTSAARLLLLLLLLLLPPTLAIFLVEGELGGLRRTIS
jgi:hypothetical protein